MKWIESAGPVDRPACGAAPSRQKEEQMPEYTVSVMPPSDADGEPFDIREWEFDAATATANRYRERGWEACVIDHGAPSVPSAATAPVSGGRADHA